MSELPPQEHESEPENQEDLDKNDELEPLPSFKIEFSGKEFDCNRENTSIFLHDRNPECDFICYEEVDEAGKRQATPLWREAFADFDNVYDWMDDHDFPYASFESEMVNELYRIQEKINNIQPVMRAYPVVEGKNLDKDLTDHEEHQVEFLSYLLEHKFLPKDFALQPDDSGGES